MKIYNKLGLFTAATLLMTSCAVNDPLMDKMEPGEVVPTVTWELASTVCKAGNEAGFLGKYYTTEEGVTISHAEVWGMITMTESAAAIQKLIPSPAYTKTVNLNDTVRGFHLLKSFPHSEEYLNGQEYHLNAAFPTSITHGPVNWAYPTAWDEASQNKFNDYYPAEFQEEFKAQMVTYLTKDSIYLSGLRNVYLNYDFTQEQFDAVNAKYPDLTPLPFSNSDVQGETKGDLWFDVDTETIVGYYYTVVENGVMVEKQIATKEEAPEGVSQDKVFPVYKAPHWIYSRYSDNTGGAVTAVRAEYMPMWKELVEMVPFEAWIYNSSDKNYAVEFSRKHAIVSQFRVVDSKGGVGKDTEYKTIELN